MMPAVGVLVPIYLIYRDFGLLDTRLGLIIVLCLGNLPIVIWMLFTYFKEIPKDILEAARMDGATITKELLFVLAPMALPGIASTPAPQRDSRLERGVLDLEPLELGGGAADDLHCILLKPGRSVLGQALGGPRLWPSHRSSFSAGSARSNWCAASPSAP